MFFRHPIIIKYHANISQLEQVRGSDWIDLRTAETVNLRAGEYKRISLGVSMMLPNGYEALVASRSSTFEKYGIIQANCPGLIDNAYCGEDDIWMFAAIAFRDTNIPMNSRICQFRIQRNQPTVMFFQGPLSQKNRGGFGSTSIKDLHPAHGK